MDVYGTKQIRNVVLLGHGGAGKSTVAEALAYLTGVTKRMGKISDGNTILLEHLPSYLLKTKKASETLKKVPDTFCSFQNTSLQNMMDEYEHEILCSALEHFGYNITKTADALGIRRQSLQYRIHKYGIHI